MKINSGGGCGCGRKERREVMKWIKSDESERVKRAIEGIRREEARGGGKS